MTIDVIIPVYCGLDESRRCIESALRSQNIIQAEIVIVDDASPEPELSDYLDNLALMGKVRLLRNPENKGFVASVNRGMVLHPDHDVVLLNSDTEVANDWLDRLNRAAYSASDIGTVTPFSNNATICSYPYEGWTGGMPGGLGLMRLDALFADTNRGITADLPTAIGFCMFIRRDCLSQVGLFDEVRFGRGYGEENDFCLRASDVGWRNILAADVFVFHEGSVSFGEERHALMKAASALLLEHHPDYLKRVHEFIGRDPLAPLRYSLDLARTRLSMEEAASVYAEQNRHRLPPNASLHILHSWGGGVDRWVHDFARHNPDKRTLILYSSSDRNCFGHALELVDPAQGNATIAHWHLSLPIPATEIHHPEYKAILASIIDGFNIDELFVSSLIGHSLDTLTTGLPTVRILHDLYPYCPAMFGFFDEPCETCPRDKLTDCLNRNPRNECWHNSRPEDWIVLRRAYAERLAQPAVKMVAPSQNARDRLFKLLPELNGQQCTIIPHGMAPEVMGTLSIPAQRPVAESSVLRVLVPGRLEPHKGILLLRDVIPKLAGKVDFLLLGCGMFGESFSGLANVQVIPDYAPADLGRLATEFAPDCALLLSILPETFSYTLSEMSALGLPTLATRMGAFQERIRHGIDGFLYEANVESLVALIEHLAGNRQIINEVATYLHGHGIRLARDMVLDYQALLAVAIPHQTSSYAPPHTTYLANGMEAILVKLQDRNIALEATITDLRARASEAQESRQATDRLARDIAALRQSSSWRITAPLRAFATLLRGLRRGERKPPLATAQNGQDTAEGNTRPSTTVTVSKSRTCLRAQLGIPDAARIVLGISPDDDQDALETFIRTAVELANSHRDLYFIWSGKTDIPALTKGAAMSLAPRRIHFLKDAGQADIAGADWVYLPKTNQIIDPHGDASPNFM